ncbi:MAG: DUF2357 domain-containing protein [Myxococcales bacterium]|nr:DUF2357 domain-containing protein [Myxococcales bacterium]
MTQQVWALSSVRWQRQVAGGQAELVLSEWGSGGVQEEEHWSPKPGLRLSGALVDAADASSHALIYDEREAPLAIASIQLQEQRDYVLEVLWEGEGESPILSCFPQLSSPVFQSQRVRRRGVVVGGRLNFRDYVGGAWFEVAWGEQRLWREAVEVRSQKLDYLKEYVVLMEDLAAQATALLFQVKSPVYAIFQRTEEGRRRAGLEHFLLLRHLMNAPSLHAAFWEIAQSPVRALTQKERWKETAQVPQRNARSWVRGLRRGETAVATVGGRELVVPRQIPVLEKSWTADTSENRFILWLLEALQRLLREMSERFQRAGELGYLADISRLTRLCERWRGQLPFAMEVPAVWPRVFPFAHLRGRAGYREVLAFSEQLSSILQLSWEEGARAIAGPLRDMAKLYEYWSFFELWRALQRVAEPIGSTTPQLEEGEQSLVLQLKRGRESVLRFRYGSLVLSLFYQLRFTVGQGVLHSYSVPMTPDFSLVLERDQKTLGVLCFDAKYRPDGSLEKMHAYRDALRGALGVYLLYPGEPDEPTIFTQDHRQPLLGVGAFPLRPQPQAREWLPAFLSVLLEQAEEREGAWHKKPLFSEVIEEHR